MLTKLQSLELNDNKISILNDKAFKGLTNLQNLYLYGNQIGIINDNAFNGLASLKELELEIAYIYFTYIIHIFIHIIHASIYIYTLNIVKFHDSIFT